MTTPAHREHQAARWEGRMGGAERSQPARALGKAVVGTLLPTAARRFRDCEAFFCAGTGRRFTFGQTNERCSRLAHGLAGLGLVKPDTVAFLCNNRVELPEIYFALAKTGLVGIPLNCRLAPVEIVALMSAMGGQGHAVRGPIHGRRRKSARGIAAGEIVRRDRRPPRPHGPASMRTSSQDRRRPSPMSRSRRATLTITI